MTEKDKKKAAKGKQVEEANWIIKEKENPPLGTNHKKVS